MEPLYLTSAECPCCETTFQISKVRSSFKNAIKYDTDFCGYYKDDVNPDYYVIRVCPSCGYAFSENATKQMSDEKKERYHAEIGKHWKEQYFHGERTIEQALLTYKRALMIAQLMKEDARLIAGFLHHIAWIYRQMNDEENEQKFLRFALEQYIVVYENEVNSAKNAKLMFMIGELYKRTEEYGEAVKWFSRVVNDQSIVDSAMIRASREQWKEISEILAERRASK